MQLPKQIKSFALVAAVLAAFARPSFAGEDWQKIPIGPFGTLNNRDNSFAIPANQAQDLLNVDLTPGGKSVRRRKGFGLAYALPITTSAVHGVYTFFDSNGNSVDLAFNDSYMNASINGGAPSVIFSTGTNGATYQCTDSLGFAYCANSAHTNLLKTNGATFSYISNVASTGTMVAACPTRLAMAGFLDAPSRIDFSAETDFTTWGSGPLGTSAAQFTINAPGSRITHLVYAFNRLMWFKNSSFGYILLGSQAAQADWVIQTVAYDVGTNDNSSVYREGVLYFRGSDGHIYGFDGTTYQRLTKEVSGTIALSQLRTLDSWTQSSAADFNSGIVPVDIDSTTNPGTLTSKTTSYTQTTVADWNAGSFDSTLYVDTETVPGTIETVFPDPFNSLRNGTNGTKSVWLFATQSTAPGTWDAPTVSGGNLVFSRNSSATSSSAWAQTNKASPLSNTGTTFYFSIVSCPVGGSASAGPAFVLNSVGGLVINSASSSNPFWWLQFSSTATNRINLSTVQARLTNGTLITGSSPSPALGSVGVSLPANIAFYLTSMDWHVTGNGVLISSGTHNWDMPTSYQYLGVISSTITGQKYLFDDYTVVPQTFTFTSRSLDTGIVSPVWSTFTADDHGSGALNYQTHVSADNLSFDAGVPVTQGSAPTSNPKRYVIISASFNNNTSTLPGAVLGLDDFTVTAGSSGTFQSAVKNASALSAWDTFQATKQDNGGTNTFAIRSATNSFSVASSTPTNWTTVVPGAIPTVSTGSYFQIRDAFYSSCSTCTPTLNDFTQNWFEGSATDKAYATYFDDKIIWSIAYGTAATTNNRLLIYDMLNQGWLLYDIQSNGFFVRGSSLYFGHAMNGNIYKFGVSDNDAGSAINAYWKSKDFYGGDPFTMQEIANISLVGKSVANSTMTVTYTLDGQTFSSYSVPCFNPSGSFVEKNRNLPAGVLGGSFNVQIGNNSADQPWEVFGMQVGVRERSWIPTP